MDSPLAYAPGVDAGIDAVYATDPRQGSRVEDLLDALENNPRDHSMRPRPRAFRDDDGLECYVAKVPGTPQDVEVVWRYLEDSEGKFTRIEYVGPAFTS